MSERKLVGDIGFDPQEGDVHGELQESFTQYLKKAGWTEADMGTRPIATEQADWLAQLDEKPERVNRIAAEAIQSESTRLMENLEKGDTAKVELGIANLRKLIETLERGVG